MKSIIINHHDDIGLRNVAPAKSERREHRHNEYCSLRSFGFVGRIVAWVSYGLLWVLTERGGDG